MGEKKGSGREADKEREILKIDLYNYRNKTSRLYRVGQMTGEAQ